MRGVPWGGIGNVNPGSNLLVPSYDFRAPVDRTSGGGAWGGGGGFNWNALHNAGIIGRAGNISIAQPAAGISPNWQAQQTRMTGLDAQLDNAQIIKFGSGPNSPYASLFQERERLRNEIASGTRISGLRWGSGI